MNDIQGQKFPEVQKQGLSKEEQIWFGKWFEQLAKLQQETNSNLGTIKGILIFFAILTIIGMVFAACSALGSL